MRKQPSDPHSTAVGALRRRSATLYSTLFLGMLVLASFTQEVEYALVFSGWVVFSGFIIALILRLQKTEVERDQALAWSRESEWRVSQLTLQQDSLPGPSDALQQLQDLKQEIAALRARELVLEKQAHYDELTALPNRALFRDRFRSAIERAKRCDTSFAVLMIDLNGFKAINDRFGHEAGDFVLVATANKILSTLRATDTVARLGGDEFALIVESITDSEEFAQVGKKLIDALFNPIRLPNGTTVGVGASMGMSVYPDDGSDLNTLLAVADQAMYHCKATGFVSLF